VSEENEHKEHREIKEHFFIGTRHYAEKTILCSGTYALYGMNVPFMEHTRGKTGIQVQC
jgi:hypothetical protein